MLFVVSPAKTLDYESPMPTLSFTTSARLLNESAELVDLLKKKEPWQLQELMGISEDLANLNANRYQSWSMPITEPEARPALYAFKGDVYTGLEAETLDDKDVQYAQQHLRILSGLYGVLRPLDLMLPYRLEMGIRLENEKGNNLYRFWGEDITQLLNQDLEDSNTDILINLASNEYFKSVKLKSLKASVITPVFKDEKNGKYKVVSFWAKKARGLMARYIIQNQLTQVSDLKGFVAEGYYYSAEESDGSTMVFLRDCQDS